MQMSLRWLRRAWLGANADLMEAAFRGSIKGIKSALEDGAFVCAKDSLALRHAVNRGNVAAVKVLIDAGADVNSADGEALVIAAQRSDSKILSVLLRGGADPSRKGGLALKWACVAGNVENVAMLMKAGARVSSHALDTAVSERRRDILAVLLTDGEGLNCLETCPMRTPVDSANAHLFAMIQRRRANAL